MFVLIKTNIMTVLSYFFSQDIIFQRIQKLLKRQGFQLTGIDNENGVIRASKGISLWGPVVKVELAVEFQGETMTSVSVDATRGKSWLNVSDKKIKDFEHRLVEKLYGGVI